MAPDSVGTAAGRPTATSGGSDLLVVLRGEGQAEMRTAPMVEPSTPRDFCGEPDWDRTNGQLIKSQLLYR